MDSKPALTIPHPRELLVAESPFLIALLGQCTPQESAYPLAQYRQELFCCYLPGSWKCSKCVQECVWVVGEGELGEQGGRAMAKGVHALEN